MDMEMSKDERKRLEKLQDDGRESIKKEFFKTFEKLTYPDLQLLLLADPTIQGLIRQIVEPMFAVSQDEEADELAESAAAGDELTEALTDDEPAGKIKASKKGKSGKSEKQSVALGMGVPSSTAQVNVPLAPLSPPPPLPIVKIERVIEKVPYEVRVEVPVHDPLRAELAPELNLLKAVKADTELAQAWLWADESEGRQLVRLLTMLSEWDEVLSLWARLANRCKDDQRAATPVEQAVLQAALALHNLRYRDRAAQLMTAEIGAAFHHETMERGTIKGSTVVEVWWPGITNAAGQLQKKPVVKTT